MKKILNFVKNNIFLIFAAYWLIDCVIGFITFKPSTLDDTARKIKALELGSVLLCSLVSFILHSVVKVREVLSKRIELVEKEVDIIYNVINETVKLMASEEDETDEESESDTEEEKEVEEK